VHDVGMHGAGRSSNLEARHHPVSTTRPISALGGVSAAWWYDCGMPCVGRIHFRGAVGERCAADIEERKQSTLIGSQDLASSPPQQCSPTPTHLVMMWGHHNHLTSVLNPSAQLELNLSRHATRVERPCNEHMNAIYCRRAFFNTHKPSAQVIKRWPATETHNINIKHKLFASIPAFQSFNIDRGPSMAHGTPPTIFCRSCTADAP
jgi:hypothetical protein